MNLWTPKRVETEFRAAFGGTKLILVSNREPYIHQDSPSGIRCEQPAGGLTSALDPVMQALAGVWVAWGSGKADRRTVDREDRIGVPPWDPSYMLRRVWLDPEDVEGYYNGFSNQTLWPLCHMLVEKARFRRRYWEAYRKTNRLFARVAVQEASRHRDPIIWLQDYHLALAPGEIRKRLPAASIALFWHIPWPAWEHFRILPQKVQLLEGLLGCDLLGFHLDQFCDNFLECVSRELDARIDPNRRTISYRGRMIQLGAFPISIDERQFHAFATSPRTEKRMKRLLARPELQGQLIGIGVDRMDYSKGILERLAALDLFFKNYPQFRGKMTFIQVSAPSRTRIKAYQELRTRVFQRIEKINRRYGGKRWKPVLHISEKLTQVDIAAYYRLADFAIISSLQDGMNLVAKEYIACQVEEKGVILLSEFAGAHEDMDLALPINPYDTEDFAWKIKSALELPAEEKKRRMRAMRISLRSNNVYRWIGSNLRAIHQDRRRRQSNLPFSQKSPSLTESSVAELSPDLSPAGTSRAG